MAFLKLLLLRHAQSLGNLEGRMEGQTSTALSPEGWGQAQRLGKRLAAEGWRPTHIYCSPLLRAVKTLQGMATAFEPICPAHSKTTGSLLSRTRISHNPLAEGEIPNLPEIPVVWANALQEYDNGVFAGLTWMEAQERYPDLCRQLEKSPDWMPIPNAETLTDGRARAHQFWRRILETHGNCDRIWIISHHWLLLQLVALVLGCDRSWGMAMQPTACFEFWLDRDRWFESGINRNNSELWQVHRFNDCQHLDS